MVSFRTYFNYHPYACMRASFICLHAPGSAYHSNYIVFMVHLKLAQPDDIGCALYWNEWLLSREPSTTLLWAWDMTRSVVAHTLPCKYTAMPTLLQQKEKLEEEVADRLPEKPTGHQSLPTGHHYWPMTTISGRSSLSMFLRSVRSNLEVGTIFRSTEVCKQRHFEARRWISGRTRPSMHASFVHEAILPLY